MAEKNVAVKIKYVSEGTEKVRSDATKLTKDITSEFKKLGAAVAGVIAVDQIVSFAKRGIKEFQEEALVSAKLTQALGYQSKALLGLAAAAAKNTLYKDDEIVAGMAQLAMYVKDEAQLKKLVPAMLDLATQTGSVDSAALMLGKTFTTNIDTIGRTGVKVKGLVGSQERLDDITKKVGDRFGGQATAMSDALGPMGQFDKNVDNLAKSLATNLVPTLNKWALALEPIMEGMGWILNHGDAQVKQRQKEADAITVELQELIKLGDEQRRIIETGKASHFQLYSEESVKQAEANLKTISDMAKDLAKPKTQEKKKTDKLVDEEELKRQKEAAKKRQDALDEIEKIRREGIAKAGEEQIALRADITQKEIAASKEMAELLSSSENEGETKRRKQRIDIAATSETKELQKTEKGRMKLLKAQQNAELDLFKAGDKRRTLLERQQAEERAAIAKWENEQKVMAYLSTAGNVLGALDMIGQASKASAEQMKIVKTGEALVSGASAAVKALDNPIPVLKWIDFAAVIASTAAQMVIINSAKFAYGGVVQGGTPGKDSVPAMLMPGEIVYNPQYPDAGLASQMPSVSHSYQISGPSITIQGNTSPGSIGAIERAVYKGTLASLKKAQNLGHLSASGLKVRN